MDLKRRILQSLRPRKTGVLLRSDLRELGSASQVSVALKALIDEGLIKKIHRGIYAKPFTLELLGKDSLMADAQDRMARRRVLRAKQTRQEGKNPTAIYVRQLAKREGIVFAPTFADVWAKAVTRLAGDEIQTDKVDDLLVALTRAGKLSPRDMTKLVVAHHRDLAGV